MLYAGNTWLTCTDSWIAALLKKDVCEFSQSCDKPVQIVMAIGINVYEWIQSQAIKTPLVLCKWASSTSLVHHISLHNPIWGVWVKCPVAVLITLAALLHLWPTFIKWATCLYLDLIKVCWWDGEQRAEYIRRFTRNWTDVQSSSYVLSSVLLFNIMWLILPPTKSVCRYL